MTAPFSFRAITSKPTNTVITLTNPSDVNANLRDFYTLLSERYTSVKLFSTATFQACLVEFVCLPALRVVRSSFGNLPWRFMLRSICRQGITARLIIVCNLFFRISSLTVN